MLSELQRVLQRALADDNPLETLRREAAFLPAPVRALVDRIDPDGFILTSLLVRKLRFERICAGDRSLADWFDREPGRFAEILAAYSRDVAPGNFFPEAEAAEFRAYCQERGYRPSLKE